MITYNFNLDPDSLEIFPSDIYNNPYVVFHGTSEYHSESLEKQGLLKGFSTFDIDSAKELLEILKHEKVAPFDVKQYHRYFPITVTQTLNSAIFGRENKSSVLSLSCLSGVCIAFSSGNLRGGQILDTIREAGSIVELAIKSDVSLKDLVTPSVKQLLDNAEIVKNAVGLVYAIQLPHDLNGVYFNGKVTHSSESIPPESILGKVYIPDGFLLTDEQKANIEGALDAKIASPGSLKNLIDQKTKSN